MMTKTIKESALRKMVSSAVREVLNEASPSYARKKLINRLYRAADRFTHGKYRDDAWQNVNACFDAIKREIGDEGELYVWCKDGGYRKGKDWAMKQYQMKVEMNDGTVIGGHLNAHAAGTVEDPFSSYDMTVHFYSTAGRVDESGYVGASCTDMDAVDEWAAKTHIPENVMSFLNTASQENGFLIGEEKTVSVRRDDGTVSAYGKGVSFTSDEKKREFAKRLCKHMMSHGFSLVDYENSGMYRTYTLVYDDTVVPVEDFKITT